ncbi:hypothetical protein ABFX02_11G021300 [Erythranthe guttata]
MKFYSNHCITHHKEMDKQFQIVTLLLVLLFVSGGVVVDVDGRKNCDHGAASKCFPKEKCDPRICAIICSRSEDYECDRRCICWWGCRNSTTTTPTHHHPPPPPPILSSSFQRVVCM